MNLAKRLALLLAVPLAVLMALGGFLHLQLKAIEERAIYVAELQLPSVATQDPVPTLLRNDERRGRAPAVSVVRRREV